MSSGAVMAYFNGSAYGFLSFSHLLAKDAGSLFSGDACIRLITSDFFATKPEKFSYFHEKETVIYRHQGTRVNLSDCCCYRHFKSKFSQSWTRSYSDNVGLRVRSCSPFLVVFQARIFSKVPFPSVDPGWHVCSEGSHSDKFIS